MGVKEKPIKNVLVVEDHFACYTQVFVTNNHTACLTARVLYEFFSVFGCPRQLMYDQASEFTGQVISEFCDLLGITKIRVTIAKMDPEKRTKWPSHLGPILITYNATRSLITVYSPYFLMFGR